ncbi:MAG: histidine--tRNA ligase [Thermodesulfobacteriota bacterium]|nr:MAG: histidine--tRNA ligase [Thermodesulfobacteriota bacterium]
MIRAVRGFNDILPGESELWRFMEEKALSVFSGYAFSEIRLPVVERTELFSRSIGETTDIVEKEMYTFKDRRGESLTLRPECTASVVRAYIENRLYATPVQKLFYMGPMFRYERPQKGRYRQFYQIGAEVLGDASPRADAEAMEMLMRYLEGLGARGVELQINSLGCGVCRPGYRQRLYDYLSSVKDSLCENCRRRISTNPLRALDCKNPGCVEATAGAPDIIDSLCEDCRVHFHDVRSHLETLSVGARVTPRMVRGLDYYTKTTFEVTADGLGAQNAVAAGGRYDNLVAELGGPETPCLGFAIGVERLALVLKASGVERTTPLIVFIALGEEAGSRGVDVVRDLREKGLKLFEDFSTGTLKKRMKRADRLGARFVVMLGEDELKDKKVTVKDMSASRQETLSWDVVYDWIAAQC